VLDIESGLAVLDSLRETVDTFGQTVMIVTHAPWRTRAPTR
jgi:ABC-type lipoprotein export system ATPase subunit